MSSKFRKCLILSDDAKSNHSPPYSLESCPPPFQGFIDQFQYHFQAYTLVKDVGTNLAEEKGANRLIWRLFIKGGMAANGSTNGNGSVAARKKPNFEVSRETREALKSTAFDVWKHQDSEEV